MTAIAMQLPISLAGAANAAVAARGLGKSIDGRAVLQDLGFTINPGEYVGIVGANGAGKTTLLKLLATLTQPTAGELSLWGKSVRNAHAALRRRIGLIDHNLMLYRDLSAVDNLEFFASLYGLSEPRKVALRMLDRVGLARRADDPIKSFSRGMAQRVAIGRALLHEPELLLADEPYTGLDAPSVVALEQLFAELRDAGRTIIVVNHDIEQTLRTVDRAIVLRRGKIAVDQPTHRLYLDEIMAEVSGS